MTRPLRLQFEGARYPVTPRGDRGKPIGGDDGDRLAWLTEFAGRLARFHATAYSLGLMGNRCHAVIQAHWPNLLRLMRPVDRVYTRRYNRRHGRVGHLVQGRLKAALAYQRSHFLAVCRYVELKPAAPARRAVEQRSRVRSPRGTPWQPCIAQASGTARAAARWSPAPCSVCGAREGFQGVGRGARQANPPGRRSVHEAHAVAV